jgi:xanthine dehydrogenase YagS FAD-binding subunit
MNSFEYASPETEAEALELLNENQADTAVLAGGTDLVSLLKSDLLAPGRVVDIKNVESLRGIAPTNEGGLAIGTLTTLEDMADSPLLVDYRSLSDVIEEVRSIQVQSMGTVGGDLCHLPNCWYFRNGHGLLGTDGGESLVAAGDNRYHAIFGNSGPAKFVSASRFAPALIAWGATVRVVGPAPDAVELIPLEYFYVTPKTPNQGVTVLKPGQLLTHVVLPSPDSLRSATYEVMQMRGLDWPLAGAAATLDLAGGIVRSAKIVLGHVAPTPWIADEAASALVGKSLNESTAEAAADVAVARATPLSSNEYKVQLARTSVKRAILRAGDLLEGGL